MKNVIVIVALLLVAIGSYSVGRMHRIGPITGGLAANSKLKSSARRLEITEEHSEQGSVKGREMDAQGADLDLPFGQTAASSERGFKRAATNLEDAIQEAQSLPVAERMGFITGLFSFIARNKSPQVALRIYKSVPETMKKYSLRALVSEWINSRCPLSDDLLLPKTGGHLHV